MRYVFNNLAKLPLMVAWLFLFGRKGVEMGKMDHCLSVIAIVAIFIGLAGSLVIVPNAHGAKITVNSLDDPGDGICDLSECTLREAIDAANPGDKILFNVSGIITLDGNNLVIDKDLTIIGPGAEKLSISGNYLSRVLYVDFNVEVKIKGVTITEGDYWQGSGIFNQGNLTLRYCEIRGCGTSNSGGDGVGIYNGSYGKLWIKTCVMTNNLADSSYGVGIYNAGELTITESEISDNYADHHSLGVGIYNAIGGNLKAHLTNIADNISDVSGAGGGIYNEGDLTIALGDISYNGWNVFNGGGIFNTGTMKIRRSAISDNIAGDGWGGGIYNWGQIYLTDSRIEGNEAWTNSDLTFGGGIANRGEMTIKRSTITNNEAIVGLDCFGGGVSNKGEMTIKHSTITNNTALNEGGGVYNEGSLTLKKTNITDNTPDDCVGCE
jgi:CSLREA domain-containing protein